MSCLFDSFCEYLRIEEGKTISSVQLRRQICDYLSTDPIMLNDDTRFTQLLGKNKSTSYIANMKRSGTWGSGFEINVFCNLYHVKVKVKVISTGKSILFQPLRCSTKKIINLDWTGSHYTYRPRP